MAPQLAYIMGNNGLTVFGGIPEYCNWSSLLVGNVGETWTN